MTEDILHEFAEHKKMVDEVRLRQEFWRGVVHGAVSAAAACAGLVALVYYIVQIVVAMR